MGRVGLEPKRETRLTCDDAETTDIATRFHPAASPSIPLGWGSVRRSPHPCRSAQPHFCPAEVEGVRLGGPTDHVRAARGFHSPSSSPAPTICGDVLQPSAVSGSIVPMSAARVGHGLDQTADGTTCSDGPPRELRRAWRTTPHGVRQGSYRAGTRRDSYVGRTRCRAPLSAAQKRRALQHPDDFTRSTATLKELRNRSGDWEAPSAWKGRRLLPRYQRQLGPCENVRGSQALAS